MVKIYTAIVLALFMVLGLYTIGYSDTEIPQAPAETIKPIDSRAALIDAYFKKKNMPLEGYGAKMVEVADQYNLDYRLLPALAVREQSGGLRLPRSCPNKTVSYNVFGWASGKTCFTSYNQAIETVGMKLGTLSYYKGKPIIKLLQTYNPPSVAPQYAYEVIVIMTSINAK